MQWTLACLVAAIVAAQVPPFVPPAPSTPAVVVVELFTSEGCSSCPPADQLLSRLSAEADSGAQILTLSEHVDYWDRLGWRDPFSAAAYTQRQSDYAARAFHSTDIFTPQMVIDGRLQAVGSDAAAVRAHIAAAARDAKARVAVRAARDTARNEIAIEYFVDAQALAAGRDAADVIIAVVENQLRIAVKRGENEGRTLAHDGVVRMMTKAATLAAGATTLSGAKRVTLSPAWAAANVRVVAFVQERKTLRIIGGGAAELH